MHILTFATVVALSLVLVSGTQLSWSHIQPSASQGVPSPRRGAALVHDAWGGNLVLFGGASGGVALNDVWRFNLGSQTWQQVNVTGSLPAGRHTFVYGLYVNTSNNDATNATSAGGDAAARPRRALIVATGQQGSAVFSDIWALDLDTATWRQLPQTGDVPEAVYGSAGGIAPSVPGGPHSSRFWLSHGFSSKRRYSTTRYYDLRAERWVLVHGSINSYNPAAPHARCIVSSTVTSDEHLVMYGGCAQNGGTGGPCPARDAWTFDGASWQQASTCPTPRTRGSMAPLTSPFGSSPELGAPSPVIANMSAGQQAMMGGGRAGGDGAPGAVLNLSAQVRLYGGRFVLLYGGYERDKQTITVSEALDDQLSVLDLDSGEWLLLRASGEVPAFRGQPAIAHEVAIGRVWVFGGQLRSGNALSNDLYELRGDPAATPLYPGGSCGSSFLYPHLHGIFMGLAWGILLQAGWFIARYFKRHDPTWFHLHRACQILGLVLSIVGLGVVMAGGVKPSNLGFSHGAIGLTALGLGLLQPLNAFFRPHKGERWRVHWEWLHLTSGRCAVVLGAANVSLGTFLVQGPYAVWITWHVMLGVFVIVVICMEVRHQRALRRRKEAGAAALTTTDADTLRDSTEAGIRGGALTGGKAPRDNPVVAPAPDKLPP
ncbi:hypothetical protein HYH02_000676 [Chlamydomonas schloesseri]|uniref:Cytochrome b561 domain-containing protein n=1 Tax=Chlamydomonas schloesseri TaxID=2026947 RepID=A0A835WV32_9CHLO|nr:hypothetical protein HYH02_000676 [Chlamydomonas schloesseri]|eukprot:KAG2454844.1 hypothetical protein HYH02_000676 [Chlamydomonas schloesseri]